jgi:hypothetical protein
MAITRDRLNWLAASNLHVGCGSVRVVDAASTLPVGLACFLKQSRARSGREVDPPIKVETARWSEAGQLDWWVKDRQQWFGRVRGADGRQRWIKAVDLRPASGSQLTRGS